LLLAGLLCLKDNIIHHKVPGHSLINPQPKAACGSQKNSSSWRVTSGRRIFFVPGGLAFHRWKVAFCTVKAAFWFLGMVING